MKNINILLVLLLYTIGLFAQDIDIKVLPVWDGTTEEVIAINDTFKITNPRQLAWLSEQYFIPNQIHYLRNKTIFIMNDMDLGGKSTPPQSWIPIGMGNTTDAGFTTIAFNGHFDGNNKKIINVYIDSIMPYYTPFRPIGLIGSTSYTDTTTIKNIILENINYNLSKNIDVGGIVGRSYYKHHGNKTTIENCHVSGIIRSHGELCGGIVGGYFTDTVPTDPNIKNCSSNCIFYRKTQDFFSPWQKVYAIAGEGTTDNGIIESCYATYQAFTTNFHGLGNKTQNCYSINGFIEQGKVFGDTIYNSYIATTQIINEIIDSNQHSVNCYFDSITYGSQSGKIIKGSAMDTAFMKTAAFVDSLNQGLSEKKWKQDYADEPINNGFPILMWQKKKQTIKWEVATDTLYVGDYFKPTATATSGLTVSYYVYDFFNWNIIGNQLFITNKGEAILIAKQEGDSIYDQAPWVYKKFYFIQRQQPNVDVEVKEIISPVADSCYDEGSTIFSKLKIINHSSEKLTNISLVIKIDTSNKHMQTFAEKILTLEPNEILIYEVPFGFKVPKKTNNNKFTTTVYINKIENDTNQKNDTLIISSCIESVSITEKETIYFKVGKHQPNPASTIVTISYSIPQQGNILLKIMNINGQLLYEKTIYSLQGNHKIELNTSSLSNGIYYYTMEYKEKTITHKMLIQR